MKKYENAFLVKYLPPTNFKGSRISIKTMEEDSNSRWVIGMDYTYPRMIDQAEEFIKKELAFEIISTLKVKGGHLIIVSVNI